MTLHTELKPDFLSALDELNKQGKIAQTAGKDFLDAVPDTVVQFNQLETRKNTVQKVADQQSQGLATRSTEILQESIEARSNPFYSILAAFTDSPSFSELDTEQKLIAHKMNNLSMATDGQISSLADEQSLLQTNLKFKQDIAQVARQNLATSSQLIQSTISAVSGQQSFQTALMDEASDETLQCIESGKCPGDRTIAFRLLQMRRDDKKSGRADRKANRKDVLIDFLSKRTITEVEGLVLNAKDKQAPVAIGEGFAIAPRDLLIELNKMKALNETQEVIFAESQVTATNALVETLDTTGVITRQTQGKGTLESAQAFGVFQMLEGAEKQAQNDLLLAREGNDVKGQRVALGKLLTARTAQAAHSKRTKKFFVEKEQAKLVNDESKIGAAEFIATNRFENDLSAIAYIDEITLASDPQMIAAGETNRNFQDGIAAWHSQYQIEKQKMLGGSGNEELTEATIASVLLNSVQRKPKLGDMARDAFANATILRDGESITIQASIVDDSMRQVISLGLNQMISEREDEVEIKKALQSLMTADGKFVNSEIADVGPLLSQLNKITAQLLVDGVITEDTNFALTLRKFMFDPATYQNNPQIFETTSASAALLRKVGFANNTQGVIGSAIARAFRKGANDLQVVEQEVANLQSEVAGLDPERALRDKLLSDLEQNKTLPKEERMAEIIRILKTNRLKDLNNKLVRRESAGQNR